MRSVIERTTIAAVGIAAMVWTLQHAGAEELCLLAPIRDSASIPESYTAVLSGQRLRLENQQRTLIDQVKVITVFEGIVDVTASDGVTPVAAGQRLRIGVDGKFSPLENIDLKREPRWWEDGP